MKLSDILENTFLFSIGTLYLCVMGFAIGMVIGFFI